MAGVDLSAVRKELAAALVAGGITAYPSNPEQLHAPAAIVDVDDVDFRTAMQRGHEKWTFLIRYLTGTASTRAAEEGRDKVFGGVLDIKQALESHTYSGAVVDVFVAEARRFDAWEYHGQTYLGVEFVTEVYAA